MVTVQTFLKDDKLSTEVDGLDDLMSVAFHSPKERFDIFTRHMNQAVRIIAESVRIREAFAVSGAMRWEFSQEVPIIIDTNFNIARL